MKPEGSVPSLQEAVTVLYHDPEKAVCSLTQYSFKIHINVIFRLLLVPSGLFFSGFSKYILYGFLNSSGGAAHPPLSEHSKDVW
jgi:hypothetical protein